MRVHQQGMSLSHTVQCTGVCNAILFYRCVNSCAVCQNQRRFHLASHVSSSSQLKRCCKPLMLHQQTRGLTESVNCNGVSEQWGGNPNRFKGA
jgi:hypothetical protein